ncbi:hypothetical protein GBA65_06415 [Rubrobacter marinus]|uniref:Ferric oxidoreductase domain-containing protein n=1 Tax=Rubrobacter marinus TaxID=2653852 RepID=A0A6G8PVI4_9ACTN|nr:ferric reductase-like transmembrane domain-containing protein [Rubrobacter marinus]QIN78204.1 hypothetical protein GBA65_06415 [Rubrobacter marinus]
MSGSVPILVSIATAGVALVCAVLAAMQGRARPSLAWTASTAGVLALTATSFGGSITPLDLAAVAGIVLVGGVAGAGWSPRGGTVLLALGLLGFAVMLYARLDALTEILDGRAALDGLAWGVARSSGFVAFLAATGAVVLGARRPSALPIGGLPARVYALHRALGIASVAAMAVHLVALWTDDFVEFTPEQLLFLPWTSEYEPFAVTLGWLAMISLALTAASGGLKRLLPGWRVVHALAYLTFALGLVHGLLAGSDSGSPWALGLYATTLIAVAWTLLRRFKNPSARPRGGGKGWGAKGLSPAPGAATRVRASAHGSPPRATG